MRIAFDSIALLGATSKNRGIGNYALDLFSTMLKQDRKNEYFFLNVLEETDYFKEAVEQKILQQDDLIFSKNSSLMPVNGAEQIYAEVLKKYLKDNCIDVFIITSPFDGRVPCYRKEWFENTRVSIIVYDIIPYIMKEHYLSSPELISWYMERVKQFVWADQLLVISQSVKDDLIEHLGIPGDKIEVIWGAPGERFRKIEVSSQERHSLYKRFKINSSFVMCTGGDDERKNIAGLISAFSKLPKELINAYQLVIVCKLQPAAVIRYTELAEKCKIKDRVVLTNFVSNEELVQFYNLASLVAFPSLYEGFGLPVVEAWACGTPVLTSNNSSLGQIGGEAAVLVDPHSVDDIAKGLELALRPEKLEELKRLGQKRLPLFQWSKVAQDTVDFLGRLKSKKSASQSKKQKLAFFTPLPPLESGIADYSVDILGSLSHFFDIDVYVDAGYHIECNLPDNVTCLMHTEYVGNRNSYVDTVFQVGNSEYHIYMWDYIKRYGGTVVLHDYNMHGVAQFEALVRNHNNIEQYRAMLSEDFCKDEVDNYIASVKKGGGLKIYDIEMNGFITNYAQKLIVHSREAKKKLLRQNIGRDVSWIRSPVRIEPLVDSKAAKKTLEIPEDLFVFAAFGHVHETKRVLPILKAFSRLVNENNHALLIFVGKLDSAFASQYKSTVKLLGISDKVHITGYTELEEFKQYIDATDVCLNLRYPYNGETSGSLMRILGKGKCVIVNDIGSFSEIPDEACIKLPSVERMKESKEIHTIYQAMKEMMENESKRKQLERAARAFAEENLDLTIIAKQYADVIVKKPNRLIDEAMLYHLSKEIRDKQFDKDDIRHLAKILAYVKE